jgi:hypothetical protein
MNETFLSELGKLYISFLEGVIALDANTEIMKNIIDTMKSNNGYDTHGLSDEKTKIDLYYRKIEAFINQE